MPDEEKHLRGVPKPAQTLPEGKPLDSVEDSNWTVERSEYDADIMHPNGGIICTVYDAFWPEPNSAATTARLFRAAPDLLAACHYPRHGDTATLLEKAADLLDKDCKPGWQSYFTPHLRRAAKTMREAIAKATK